MIDGILYSRQQITSREEAVSTNCSVNCCFKITTNCFQSTLVKQNFFGVKGIRHLIIGGLKSIFANFLTKGCYKALIVDSTSYFPPAF